MYRVYVVAIEDSEDAFLNTIGSTASWAELTDDPLAFEDAEKAVGQVEYDEFPINSEVE